jgi:hypothetical protein
MNKASFALNQTLVRTMNMLAVHHIMHCVADIIQFWQLDAKQACLLLGDVPIELWTPLSTKDPKARFSAHPSILERMELIISIHHTLNMLIPNQQQIEWIKRPHEVFTNRAPIDAMSLEDIEGLTFTKNYLIARNARVMSPLFDGDQPPRL